MKVIVKTLQGKQFPIEIDQSYTVLEVKIKLKNEGQTDTDPDC
jgi:hypothetical protein